MSRKALQRGDRDSSRSSPPLVFGFVNGALLRPPQEKHRLRPGHGFRGDCTLRTFGAHAHCVRASKPHGFSCSAPIGASFSGAPAPTRWPVASLLGDQGIRPCILCRTEGRSQIMRASHPRKVNIMKPTLSKSYCQLVNTYQPIQRIFLHDRRAAQTEIQG